MRLGVHIRIAEGLVKALDRAQELNCEAVQLFSGNPNSWIRKPLNMDAAARFRERTAQLGIFPVVLHTPYLLNLASPENDIWNKSKDALADAVSRAPHLGADYIVTHIGSHRGAGYNTGIERIRNAVRFALDADEHATICLELGAGAGNSIGSTFEEIGDILSGLQDAGSRVGICIDTAHLWGSGYRICDQNGVNAMFADLTKCVGMNRLKVVHLNDTLMGLGSHRDRHHHIGEGEVGESGFAAILNYSGLNDIPGIIETPGQANLAEDKKNLAALRKLEKTAAASAQEH